METFDLMDLVAQGYENRQVNVFYQKVASKTLCKRKMPDNFN